MAAAPLVYNDDESVAWERMWDSFCVLASAGGPPHRASLLQPPASPDPTSAGYQANVAEIVRGIRLVSGLAAEAAEPGWVAVECGQAAKARWLSEQIRQENVASLQRGSRFFVPVGEHFTVKGEVKNVITAVAKTTHYWQDHLAAETKSALEWETRLAALWERLKRWPKSSRAAD
jgi:sirohydrochlorin cobaltochelatase